MSTTHKLLGKIFASKQKTKPEVKKTSVEPKTVKKLRKIKK
jgi:hypothetical protein